MYLFTRTGRLRPGNTREGMAWAVGVTEKVNQITSLNVGLWTTFASPGTASNPCSFAAVTPADAAPAAEIRATLRAVCPACRPKTFTTRGATFATWAAAARIGPPLSTVPATTPEA